MKNYITEKEGFILAKVEKLRVFEAFSGVGMQHMALKNIGADFEIVGISEIDQHAIASYTAIHGDVKNFGDISKLSVDELPDFDLFTYSFPCQDISLDGRQLGLTKHSNTRSSLLWDCKRIIEKKKPRFLLLENVKNLVSKRHIHDFEQWIECLNMLGYTSSWKVYNATSFGIPQTRERVFMVSVLDSDVEFKHPNGFPLEKCLKDFLEDSVADKYFLSKDQQNKYIYGVDDDGNLLINNNTKIGYLLAKEYDGIDFTQPSSKTRRGRVQQGKIQTLTTSCNLGTLVGGRFRKLTALEYWRLMGISDEDFEKASQVVPETHLYKQAGNGIVVPVLESIFSEMYKQFIG